jgi:hypothetical protein
MAVDWKGGAADTQLISKRYAEKSACPSPGLAQANRNGWNFPAVFPLKIIKFAGEKLPLKHSGMKAAGSDADHAEKGLNVCDSRSIGLLKS